MCVCPWTGLQLYVICFSICVLWSAFGALLRHFLYSCGTILRYELLPTTLYNFRLHLYDFCLYLNLTIERKWFYMFLEMILFFEFFLGMVLFVCVFYLFVFESDLI